MRHTELDFFCSSICLEELLDGRLNLLDGLQGTCADEISSFGRRRDTHEPKAFSPSG